MKRLVYTVTHGRVFEEMAKLTHPSLVQYARRHGADFMVIGHSGRIHPMHPSSYEDFQIPEFLKVYDQVVHLDTDVVVANDTPWLLDVSMGRMCAFDESLRDAGDVQKTRVRYFMDYCYKTGKNPMDGKFLKPWGRYFNLGVFAVTKRDASIFEDPEGFYDDTTGHQTFLNHRIMERGHTVHDLGPEFNCMSHEWERSDYHKTAFVVHYAAIRNYNWLMNQITVDISELKALGRL
mgnify:CR=1 FL=1